MVVDEVSEWVSSFVVALEVAVVDVVLVVEAFATAIWVDVCCSLRRIEGIIDMYNLRRVVPEFVVCLRTAVKASHVS